MGLRILLVLVAALALGSSGCAATAPPVTLAQATDAPAPAVPPTPSTTGPTAVASSAVDPVTIAYGEQPDQFGHLTVPATTTDVPVVVLVHGGFWQQLFDLSLMDALAVDLVERGYAVWNIEYRRVGAGGMGGWPETGDDVGAAIDHLDALAAIYPLDLDQVVLVGHSAGGHLALWALDRSDAAVRPVAAIGLGAVVDPSLFLEGRALLGGTSAEMPDAYQDATPQLDPKRMVLIQVEFDRIVATATLQPARDAGVPVVLVNDENHFDLIDPASQSWIATLEAIADFLQ